MNIENLYEMATAYTKANPSRPVFADLIAYDYLIDYIGNASDYDKIISPDISIDVVWARAMETSTPFSMEWGYESLGEFIQEWLGTEKLWFDKPETSTVLIQWDKYPEPEPTEVVIGLLPDHWESEDISNHPSDDSIFYWVTEDEWDELTIGFSNGEWTIVGEK